jgi:RNA-directed DNA polymerase
MRTRLSLLPVHAAATGYVPGQNIRENAGYHVDSKIILKLDFREFFPSLTVGDWRRYVISTHPPEILKDDLDTYNKILFWGQGSRTPKCLSIGAPSSPVLSNVMLFGIDNIFRAHASKLDLIYTRYADDITVSGNSIENVLRFEALATRTINTVKSPNLTFNDEKRGLFRKGQKLMVTGLVITPMRQISIGRDRKRLISVLLHKVIVGQTDQSKILYLRGLMGFALATEPEFIDRMRRKYGNPVIDSVLKFSGREG